MPSPDFFEDSRSPQSYDEHEDESGFSDNEYGDVEVIKNASYKKLKEERNKNNYLVLGAKPFFHFANYKSVDVTGVVDIHVPGAVMKVLRKWISLQDSKYLFSNLNLLKYLLKILPPLLFL